MANKTKKSSEDWIQRKWRPLMAVQYMLVCLVDFIIFPVLYTAVQVWVSNTDPSQWAPITLQGGGLYHIAMGAVLGITAWTRGQEKLTQGYTREEYNYPQPQQPGPRYQHSDNGTIIGYRGKRGPQQYFPEL